MTRKTTFFEGWSWFKFNNLGLALGTNLKFYTSVAKGLKLKVRKFLGGANSYVCRSYRGKTGRGPFCPPSLPSWIGLRKQLKQRYLSQLTKNGKIKQRVDVDQGIIHQLLCSTCLKAETEGLVMASQDQSLFTRNYQAIIIKKGAGSSFVKNSKICRSTSIWIIHNDS